MNNKNYLKINNKSYSNRVFISHVNKFYYKDI